MLDLGMPHLNGYERRARSVREPWGRRAPAAWRSRAGASRAIASARFEAGFDAHLVKPVDRNEVLNAIRSARVSIEGANLPNTAFKLAMANVNLAIDVNAVSLAGNPMNIIHRQRNRLPI